jgi:choline dehydrogenase-like flavoprotein
MRYGCARVQRIAGKTPPMITDARQLDDGTTIQADVAVVGGGPAGITVARALADSGVKVCVVEAGGRELDAKVQALYEGENACDISAAAQTIGAAMSGPSIPSISRRANGYRTAAGRSA